MIPIVFEENVINIHQWVGLRTNIFDISCKHDKWKTEGPIGLINLTFFSLSHAEIREYVAADYSQATELLSVQCAVPCARRELSVSGLPDDVGALYCTITPGFPTVPRQSRLKNMENRVKSRGQVGKVVA